jgi:transposase
MRFYTTQHPFYCGIDRHARTMYVCILDQNSEVLVHRHMKTDPEAFLKAMAPYRPGIVVAVECLFPWYWLADLCADEGLPFVLGHALSMKALHGGKATNDTSDSQKIAALLRGGMLPQASVSPAQMRATRDLLRRRMPLAPTRAELLAHVHNTHSQYHLPAIGKKIAYKANREGVAARFADPAVQKSLAVDLALITSYAERLRDVALTIVTTANHHDANTRYLLQTVPGIGTILSLVLLYDIHQIDRFPRVQDVLSSCRLGKCRKASAGKRRGTSGATIGNAHLTGAFSEAAVLFRRDHPAAQQYLARLEKKHAKGTAFTILAQQLARAVSSRLTRQVAFDTETFFQREGRGAEEPEASLDNQGNAPQRGAQYGCMPCVRARQSASRSRYPEPFALIGPPLSLLFFAALVANGQRVLLLTRA